jgi:hypothetical protein
MDLGDALYSRRAYCDLLDCYEFLTVENHVVYGKMFVADRELLGH